MNIPTGSSEGRAAGASAVAGSTPAPSAWTCPPEWARAVIKKYDADSLGWWIATLCSLRWSNGKKRR